MMVVGMGCAGSSGKDKVIPFNDMKMIMWDMMKADEWYIRQFLKDSTLKTQKENIRLYEQVFAIHGITREKFYKSFQFYESRPPEFKLLLDSVELYANRERVRLSNTDKFGQSRK